MNSISWNKIPSIYSSLPTTPSVDLLSLYNNTALFLEGQTKSFAFVGISLSSLGALYSSFFPNTYQSLFCAATLAVCLGTAYRQGWLEEALTQANREIEDLKKNLIVTQAALSDREILLSTLGATKEKLQSTIEALEIAKETEKSLSHELDLTRKQQQELSNIVTELTTISLFFQNLKESYPDPKELLDHLSSIEKITQVVKKNLTENHTDVAIKLSELKEFLESLHKQDVDKMALLLKINKTVNSIQEGVDLANHSLGELKSQNNISS